MQLSNATLSGGSATDNFLNLTGTFPSTTTAPARGVLFSFTTAGNSAFAQVGQRLNLSAGYTGAQSAAIVAVNAVAGTGTNGWASFGSANFGFVSQAVGTTQGNNIGTNSFAYGSASLNIGANSQAINSYNSPALNIGATGMALNGTASVGGFFGLMSTAPALTSSAALVADNGAQSTAPIFLARANGAEVLRIDGSGNVGIGTASPTHPLSVNGAISAKEVIVSSTGADYVFEPGYRLAPLSEVADYIEANRHLPNIPAAHEVEEKGVSVGEMQSKLLAKIEELTLHAVEADRRIRLLEEKNRELSEEMEKRK